MSLRNSGFSLRVNASFAWLGCIALLAPVAFAQATSTVIVRTVPNPVVQGQNVAIIAGVNPTGSSWPTGTITVSDTVQCPGATTPTTSVLGSFALGSAGSTNPGEGTLQVSSFPCIGPNQIIASYSGDSNYSPTASQPVIQTVLAQFTPTSTTLASSANPATAGQSVTLTATLTYTFTNNSHTTGTVTFTDTNTGIVLGAANVETVGAGRDLVTIATITTLLSAGTYAVQASYSGDNIYGPSTSQILNEVVQQAASNPTATTLSASAGQLTQGQPVTLAATVTSPAGTPSGQVTFYDANNLLGAVNLDGNGNAALTISSLSVGAHMITAAYGGASAFLASTSGAVNVTVQGVVQAASTTVLNSSANPAIAGNPVVLVAAVTSQFAGTLTGSVTFLNGSSVLGTVPLQNGAATLATSFAAGAYLVTATYSGDTNFAASSGTLSEVVNPPTLPATTTTIASTANPSTYGQPITFTAVVSGGSSAPTGNITFHLDSMDAVVTLDSKGIAVFTTSAAPVGNDSVTAIYSGDATHAGSTSPVLALTVSQASTKTTLQSTSNPSSTGAPVTFIATVAVNAPGAGTPTGTIAFVADNLNTLCAAVPVQSDLTAKCTSSTLTAGTHTINAAYGGDTDFQTSSNTLSQIIAGSAIPIQLGIQGSGFVYSRATGLFTTTLTITNGNAQAVGPVQVLFTGLPPEVTVANSSGLYNGSPYLTVPGTLNPGQSVSFLVQFADPRLASITYAVNFYSGVF